MFHRSIKTLSINLFIILGLLVVIFGSSTVSATGSYFRKLYEDLRREDGLEDFYRDDFNETPRLLDAKLYFGVKGNGTSNDRGRIRDAIGYVAGAGSHKWDGVYLPPTSAGYCIKEPISVCSGVLLVGDDTLLINKVPEGRALFELVGRRNEARGRYWDEVNNVTIKGFRVDGGGKARSGVSMSGVTKNISITDMHFFDHHNYAIAWGDDDACPDTAYFKHILLDGIRIDGSVGTDYGSGINFFCRSQNDSRPAAENLLLQDIVIDVSNGVADRSEHGDQGIKLNNVNGAVLERIGIHGGRLSGVTVTNGSRHVYINDLETSNSLYGLRIRNNNNNATTETSYITVENYTGTNHDIGLEAVGEISNFNLGIIDVEGGMTFENASQWQMDLVNVEGDFYRPSRSEEQMVIQGLQSGAEGILKAAYGQDNNVHLCLHVTSGEFIRNERIRSLLNDHNAEADIYDVYQRNPETAPRMRDITIRSGSLENDNPEINILTEHLSDSSSLADQIVGPDASIVTLRFNDDDQLTYIDYHDESDQLMFKSIFNTSSDSLDYGMRYRYYENGNRRYVDYFTPKGARYKLMYFEDTNENNKYCEKQWDPVTGKLVVLYRYFFTTSGSLDYYIYYRYHENGIWKYIDYFTPAGLRYKHESYDTSRNKIREKRWDRETGKKRTIIEYDTTTNLPTTKYWYYYDADGSLSYYDRYRYTGGTLHYLDTFEFLDTPTLQTVRVLLKEYDLSTYNIIRIKSWRTDGTREWVEIYDDQQNLTSKYIFDAEGVLIEHIKY